MGGVKRAGAPKTKATKFGEVYFLDFLKANNLSENRVRYWLKVLEVKMRYVKHPGTGRTRGVLTKEQARAILKAVNFNRNKLKALKAEARGFRPQAIAA